MSRDAVRHLGHAESVAPHEQASSVPSRGGTSGRPTPFQAVTRPQVFMTPVFNQHPNNL